jgi:hypothetical protein
VPRLMRCNACVAVAAKDGGTGRNCGRYAGAFADGSQGSPGWECSSRAPVVIRLSEMMSR